MKYAFKKGSHSKENNTKINMQMSSFKNWIWLIRKHVFINSSTMKMTVATKKLHYFIMHGLGLCIKVDSYVAHMFYEWSFSHNRTVPIYINKNEYFIYLNTKNTVFARRARNYNKNTTQ